tara:strand:+ start:466 stop:822 length:357 start_codon:yes stop_codon:yes gene_type:complete
VPRDARPTVAAAAATAAAAAAAATAAATAAAAADAPTTPLEAMRRAAQNGRCVTATRRGMAASALEAKSVKGAQGLGRPWPSRPRVVANAAAASAAAVTTAKALEPTRPASPRPRSAE